GDVGIDPVVGQTAVEIEAAVGDEVKGHYPEQGLGQGGDIEHGGLVGGDAGGALAVNPGPDHRAVLDAGDRHRRNAGGLHPAGNGGVEPRRGRLGQDGGGGDAEDEQGGQAAADDHG